MRSALAVVLVALLIGCSGAGHHGAGQSLAVGDARALEVDVDSGGVSLAAQPTSTGSVVVSTVTSGAAPSALPVSSARVGDRFVVMIGRSGGTSQLPFVAAQQQAYHIEYPPDMALTVRAFSGDVVIETPKGPVQVTNAQGNVTVRNPAKALKIDDTSGSITVNGALAGVDVAADNGAVTVTLAPGWHPSPIRMESGNGNVSLSVPPTFRAHLDASSGSGKVTNALPAAAGRAKRPPVWLYTSSGTITIGRLPQ